MTTVPARVRANPNGLPQPLRRVQHNQMMTVPTAQKKSRHRRQRPRPPHVRNTTRTLPTVRILTSVGVRSRSAKSHPNQRSRIHLQPPHPPVLSLNRIHNNIIRPTQHRQSLLPKRTQGRQRAHQYRVAHRPPRRAVLTENRGPNRIMRIQTRGTATSHPSAAHPASSSATNTTRTYHITKSQTKISHSEPNKIPLPAYAISDYSEVPDTILQAHSPIILAASAKS